MSAAGGLDVKSVDGDFKAVIDKITNAGSAGSNFHFSIGAVGTGAVVHHYQVVQNDRKLSQSELLGKWLCCMPEC